MFSCSENKKLARVLLDPTSVADDNEYPQPKRKLDNDHTMLDTHLVNSSNQTLINCGQNKMENILL